MYVFYQKQGFSLKDTSKTAVSHIYHKTNSLQKALIIFNIHTTCKLDLYY